LGGEQQDRSRDRWLRHGRFVEIPNGAHLRPRQLSLKGPFAAFNAGNKLRDIILFLHFLRLNLPTFFVVKPADESHPGHQLFRRIGDKVEDRILLPNLRGNHSSPLVYSESFTSDN